MHLSIKVKQIGGVSLIVGLAVSILTVIHGALTAEVLLSETRARAELLSNAIIQRARDLAPGADDPWAALRADRGLRAIVDSGAYSGNVIYVAICSVDGVARVAFDASLEDRFLTSVGSLDELLARSPLAQLTGVVGTRGRLLEATQPLLLGDRRFGSIRVGVSTALMREEIIQALHPMIATGLGALLVAMVVSAFFVRLILRPIHVIRSGLTRLGRGEFGVRLDLPQQDEFGELGSFFNTVSEQLSADRSQAADQSMLNVSRKLVALGRLSAGVAHEVRNPLNAMTIHLELLRQKLTAAAALARTAPNGQEPVPTDAADERASASDAASVLEHVRIIAGEIQRLDQVMQSFLKFTRTEDLRLQSIALGPLVDEIVRVLAPEFAASRVLVSVEGFDGIPQVTGDPAMLRQALMNLVQNACQAMPAGGRLRLFAEPASGGRVLVGVEDTGVGISPENLGRIFNLYFTTREQGSGIGLAMVYRTVQLHDGEIEVQSKEGEGTTFRILLPEA